MSKRRLSKRQLARIQHQQQRHSSAANAAETHQGLLVTRYGRQADIETADGTLLRCRFRTNLGNPVAGDRVIYQAPQQADEGKGIVVALEERRSLLERPDSFGKLRPVAANLDQLLIVIAPQPEPFANLIDRYLVVAENSHLEAVLILNKADLLNSDGDFQDMLERYRRLDYRVLQLSAHDLDSDISPLTNLLREHRSIFVGQSGVGKSSLINRLLPAVQTEVGALSDSAGKGKHTTTASRLYHLASGGDLIDSPGIREFSLEHFSPAQVYQGFRELQPALGHCRFRDCRHQQEPGCAVKALLDSEAISPARRHSLNYILENCSDR